MSLTTDPKDQACMHEYTLNVQLTHAWCQKCDLVIPITEGQSVMVLIAARAAAAEQERIRQLAIDHKAVVLRHDDPTNPVHACELPFADLLGGASHTATTERTTS